MRRFLPLFVLLSACSSRIDDDSSSDEVRSAGSEICSAPRTLFRLEKPNPEHFITYADEQVARAAAAQLMTLYGQRVSPTPPSVEIVSMVAEVYEAFRAIYPEHTAGMSHPPTVVLIDDPSPQAFAATDPTAGNRLPWLFFIHTGLLTQPEIVEDRTRLESTIAHELAHLILKNILARDAYKFYRLKGSSERNVFGFAQPNDKDVARAYSDYQRAARYVGRFYARGLGAFPYEIGASGPVYGSYLELIAGALPQGAQNASCTQAAAEGNTLQQLVARRIEKSDITLALREDEASAGALAQAWERDVTACLSLVTTPLATLIESGRAELVAQGATPQRALELLPDLDEADRALDRGASKPTIVRLLEMARARREAIRAIVESTTLPYASLRFFTDEEEADDASARVMFHLRKPVDLILNAYRPDYRSACVSSPWRNERPEYGGFVDAHHALCWRYVHMTSLHAALDENCSAQR